MRALRARAAVIAAVAALGLVSGCGEGDPPSRAGTIETQPADDALEIAPEDPDVEEVDETEEPVTDDAAGRLLTVKEARAALPKVGDLPSGWSADPDETLGGDDDDAESDDTVRPERCEAIFDSLNPDDENDPEAEASASFTRGGFGPWLEVEISSFTEEVEEERIGRVLDALGQCTRFTVDAHDGEGPVKYQVSPLSMANLGEESAAFRVGVEAGGMEMLMDFAVVRNGHNLVTGITAGLGAGMATDAMEKQLRQTMERLAG